MTEQYEQDTHRSTQANISRCSISLLENCKGKQHDKTFYNIILTKIFNLTMPNTGGELGEQCWWELKFLSVLWNVT